MLGCGEGAGRENGVKWWEVMMDERFELRRKRKAEKGG